MDWLRRRRPWTWSRRRWVVAATLGTCAVAAGSYLYYWLYNDVEENEDDGEDIDSPFRFLNSLTTNHDATSQALGFEKDAERNLQAHFENIQRISDGTTLPQMLLELERGLERAASVDVILGELRQSNSGNERGQNLQTSKLELWNELKLVSWSRCLAAIWLTALLDLLLRVQLNILGRHLFFQQNATKSPRFRAEIQSSAIKIVSEGSQEMFLEYAHYLPERAVMSIVRKLRDLVIEELGSVELKSPVTVEEILSHARNINAAFEIWAVEESWANLALPSEHEAQEYFAGFRSSATPLLDPSSNSDSDSEIVQGMVEELHMIMKSARFSAVVLEAAQVTFKYVEENLIQNMGSQSLPLAKVIPKITSASNDLLEGKGDISQDYWIQNIANLPRVKELCGSVYSCGPPPAFIGSS